METPVGRSTCSDELDEQNLGEEVPICAIHHDDNEQDEKQEDDRGAKCNVMKTRTRANKPSHTALEGLMSLLGNCIKPCNLSIRVRDESTTSERRE